MTRRGPADIQVATRLLAIASTAGAVDGGLDAALSVYEDLAARLEPLIGVAGMRALVTRSARLTAEEYPCFAALGVASGPESAAPSGERLSTSLRQLDAAAIRGAATAFYATFIALLTSLIGDALVSQVLRSAFPALEPNVPKETVS